MGGARGGPVYPGNFARILRNLPAAFGALLLAVLLVRCGGDSSPAAALSIDSQLAAVVAAESIEPLQLPPPQPQAKVALGRALFYDKILSGSRNISCASCHQPASHTSDALSVSIGEGGTGTGPARQLGEGRAFIARNTPDLFNRGHPAWRTMFWDARVARSPEGVLLTPAGPQLPPGIEGVLAAQALFPPASRAEMRGQSGDLDANGDPNELALIDDSNLPAIWQAIMARVLAIPGYPSMFAAAYPGVPPGGLGIQHAVNAIAAYESQAFGFTDSPWDEFLAGNTQALTPLQKQGALLFFGEARCSMCHGGPLFTDQRLHTIAVPQVGPGSGEDAPLDLGGFRVTGDPLTLYSFRTPPLRNVALTGPWFHDGAYTNLRAAVRHYGDPARELRNYDESQLRQDLQGTFQDDPAVLADMSARISPILQPPLRLTPQEIDALVAFLNALTSPSALDLTAEIPAGVPSGLPVGD